MRKWKKQGNKLTRNFEFKDFEEALKFVNRVGKIAETAGHHPDIFLYNYNKVKLSLTTHDKKGITEKDYALAQKINKI